MIAFELDIFVLGKLTPIAMVGIYSMSRRLALTPKELYARIFGPILLSAFSVKQDDRHSLRKAILKMTKATAVLGLPAVGFAVVCAGAILYVILGKKYISAAVPFGLLSVCTLVRTQAVTLASVYLALGRPHLHRRFVAIRALVLGCLIYPAITHFGMVGAAAAVLFAEVTGLFMQVVWMQKEIGFHLVEYLLCWLSGLLLALIVIVPVSILKLSGVDSVFLNLVVGAGLCVLACGLGLVILRGKPKNSGIKKQSIKLNTYLKAGVVQYDRA